MHAGRLCEMRGDGGGMRIFECVCVFMNFRQVPLSAGLWESAYSTVSATVSGCMWRRLAGVIRWVSP